MSPVTFAAISSRDYPLAVNLGEVDRACRVEKGESRCKGRHPAQHPVLFRQEHGGGAVTCREDRGARQVREVFGESGREQRWKMARVRFRIRPHPSILALPTQHLGCKGGDVLRTGSAAAADQARPDGDPAQGTEAVPFRRDGFCVRKAESCSYQALLA